MRSALTAAATVLFGLAISGGASATFIPGPNGKIVFTSGRGAVAGDDNNARIWVADYPSGAPVQVTTMPAGQHRHPNWSPDHSRIVYAAGPAFTGPFALWIKDLATGSETEFVPAAAAQDRPSWSPDGTRIAYGSGGKIMVKDVAPGSVAQAATNGTTDERPVWSPDGNTLYFNRGPKYNGTPGTGDKDIFKTSPVTPAGAGDLVTGALNVDDWQAALSPDGTRLCYLRGPQNNLAELWTVSVALANPSPFASDPTKGNLNCVWSPDGTRVLYTLGAFELGDLATRDVAGGDFVLLSSMNIDGHFDGNADWATNFSPKCDDKNATTAKNAFVSITLTCTDPDAGFGASPPTPTPLPSEALEIVAPPIHGNIGALTNSRVIYTPAKDFAGTDTFTYRGTDDVSNASPATVTVTTAAGGAGGGGVQDQTPPVVSDITVSTRRWRRGTALPQAARAKVGTTIAFRLDEAAQPTIAFARVTTGRRVGGSCVKRTRANRAKPRCTRFVAAGSIARPTAQAGSTKVRFQGRLSSTRRLALGTYRVAVGAQDAAGNRAIARNGPRFTIVAR